MRRPAKENVPKIQLIDNAIHDWKISLTKYQLGKSLVKLDALIFDQNSYFAILSEKN